jgi:hypothetical protein
MMNFKNLLCTSRNYDLFRTFEASRSGGGATKSIWLINSMQLLKEIFHTEGVATQGRTVLREAAL